MAVPDGGKRFEGAGTMGVTGGGVSGKGESDADSGVAKLPPKFIPSDEGDSAGGGASLKFRIATMNCR